MGKKIHGGVMKALGHTWHQECFKCSECGGKLEARYADRDGEPVCSSCSSAPGVAKQAQAARGNASQSKATPLRNTSLRTAGTRISQSTGRTSPPATHQPGSKAAVGLRSKVGGGAHGTVVKQSALKMVSMGSAKGTVENLTV